MYGMRGLYNFGWRADHAEEPVVVKGEMMEGGLRGRFSAGGEVYFSAQQRSFGGTSASFRALQWTQLMSSINRTAIYNDPTEHNLTPPRFANAITTNNPNTPLQPPNGIHIVRILRPSLTNRSNLIQIRRKRLLIRERPEYRR
jgi:hypothetical protein